MSNPRKGLYWDAPVWLSYINERLQKYAAILGMPITAPSVDQLALPLKAGEDKGSI